ncbi:MAG: LamG-like jellyroll fold domain-containing protein [Phycisphaerae bacterium]
MKKILNTLILTMFVAASANAVIFYNDDFTTDSAVHDDASGYYTSPVGTATAYAHLQSIDTDAYQRIESNQWNLREYNSGSGDGFYFQEIGEPARTYYNWATSPLAPDIINGGGIEILFDITYSDIADNSAWIEFAFGTGNSASTDGRRYDDSDVDFGFRFEGDRIDMKDNGAGVGTVSYGTPLSNNVTASASVSLAFDSFAEGTSVNATLTIGDNIFTNSFTLDTTDDFRFSFGPGYYLDEDSILVDNLFVQTVIPTGPVDPYPANKEKSVPLEVTLQWNGDSDETVQTQLDPSVTKYNLYIDYDNTDTDPNLYYLDEVAVTDWSSRAASYGPLSLSYDQSVTWQVEEIKTNEGVEESLFGPVWTFEAIKSVPVVPTDSLGIVRVFEGQGAEFTVEFGSASAPTVTWYHYDNITETAVTEGVITIDNGDGTFETGLSIVSTTTSDEGQYYCKVSNSGGSEEYQSGTADLIINRLLAQYSFDGDLADSSANGAPAGIAMSTAGDPNTLLHVETDASYDAGIDGTASAALDLAAGTYISFGTDGYPNKAATTASGFGAGLDEGTIIFWIKPVANVAQMLLGNANDGSATAWSTEFSSPDDLRLFIRDSAGRTVALVQGSTDRPEFDLNDGTWHLMATCWGGGSSAVYVDGQLANSANGASSTDYDPWQYSMLLGAARDSSDRTFLVNTFDGGKFDNMRIFNYRLDSNSDVFAQEYVDITGVAPCVDMNFLDGLANANLDNTGSSYCRVDLADFAEFAIAWLENGLY